jgi:hypothetical protein
MGKAADSRVANDWHDEEDYSTLYTNVVGDITTIHSSD